MEFTKANLQYLRTPIKDSAPVGATSDLGSYPSFKRAILGMSTQKYLVNSQFNGSYSQLREYKQQRILFLVSQRPCRLDVGAISHANS